MTHDPELVGLVADLLEDLDGNDLEVVARAVLDAITTSHRHALVELPEPAPGWCYVYQEDGDAPDHLLFGEIDEFVVTRWGPGSGVQVSHQGEPLEPLSPYEARSLAAALIAAARSAESTATEQEWADGLHQRWLRLDSTPLQRARQARGDEL